jgi:hypothetical protein
MIYESEKGKVEKLNDDDYSAACISCGETKDIQLWPHRNGHGCLIGFVFACKGCKDIVPGITMSIHGIRGHSEDEPPAPPQPPALADDELHAAISRAGPERVRAVLADDGFIEGVAMECGDDVAKAELCRAAIYNYRDAVVSRIKGEQ